MPLQIVSHLHQELTISSVTSSIVPLNCHFTIVTLANISFESTEKLKCLGVTQSKIAFIQKLKVKLTWN